MAERRIHSSQEALIAVMRGLATACLLLVAQAQAAEPVTGAAKYALNNLHDEMSQCYAFYMLTAEGLRKRDPSDRRIARMEAIGDHVMRCMHGIQQMIGMSDDAGLARTRMRTSQQMSAIGGDFVNFAILLERYGETCKQLVDRPKDRAVQLKAMEEQRAQQARQ